MPQATNVFSEVLDRLELEKVGFMQRRPLWSQGSRGFRLFCFVISLSKGKVQARPRMPKLSPTRPLRLFQLFEAKIRSNT